MNRQTEPSERRAVASAAGPVLVGNAVSNVAMGAIAVVTSRQLGPSGRGVLVLFITLASFTMLLCSVGANIAARVHLVSATERVSFGDYLGLTIVLSATAAVLGALSSLVVLPLAHVRVSPVGAAVVGLYGATLLIALLLRDALYGIGLSARAAWADSAGSIAQLVLTLVLVWRGGTQVELFVAALAVGTLFQAEVSLATLRRATGVVRAGRSPAAWRLLVVRGLPGVVVNLGQAATFKMDRYLLGVLVSSGAVGVYSVAATMTEILWLIPVAVAQVIFHRLASRATDLPRLSSVRWVTLGVTAGAAAVLWVISPTVIDILLGDRFASAVPALRILLVGAVAVSSYHLDVNALAAMGRIGSAGIAAAAGFAIVTIADVALIPRHGMVGAAWASTIGYTAMAVLSRMMLERGRKAPPVSVGASVPC